MFHNMPLADSPDEDDPLRELECRASTIDELLSERFRPLPGSKGTASRAGERLSAWCAASTGGDWHLFARRLERDGLTFEEVLPRLAAAMTDPSIPTPRWVTDAAWVLAAMKSAPAATSGMIEPVTEPVAFEPLLLSLVDAAFAEVRTAGSAAMTALRCEVALAPMRRALLLRLSELCSPALYAALRCWQADPGAGSTGSALMGPGFDGESASDPFEPFVEHMRASGLDRLFVAKPVLLRLIASITRQWIDATLEFTHRLAQDAAAIRASLLREESESPVASVEGGLGDLHNGGRSVLLVTFDDGQRILYKPKDLRPDAFWHRLVDWLNMHEAPIDLRTARVLVREGYGWAEFIEPSDCPDGAAVARFYQRAGAWLALFHLFAAADMHYENLIAAGEQPVPIDLEMLLQMGKLDGDRAVAEREALDAARRRVDESIIATGLLPAYARTPDNALIGLGGLNESPADVSETFWEDVNTLRMRPVRRRRATTTHANLPTENGAPAPLSRFGAALIDGFDRYGRHLVDRGRDLVEAGWLDAMRGVPVRRLLRPTRFYVFLMERVRDPRNLADGALWSAHLDFVARLSEWDEADPAWPLLRAERAALAALNVPFFLAISDGNVVFDRYGHAAQGLGRSGLMRARDRLLSWDDAELEWQRRIVSTSVASLPGAPALVRPRLPKRSEAGVPADPAQRQAKFLDVAREAAAGISGLALRRGSSAAWIGLDWLGDSEVSQLVPLGFDLYNGAPGVALFLAAFARVTGDHRSAALAIEALAPLRSHLRGANAHRLARGLGVGAATGLGSVVYGLSTIGRLLGREDIVADALRAAHLCTDELIDADRVYDVIGGSAGGILGLLKLHRLTGDADVVERAEQCGRHLIAHVGRALGCDTPASGERNGWRPLTGMSHGAAGLAYAFASLHRATRGTAYAAAARDCIAYENRTFSAVHVNWPDLRQQVGEQSWPCQWCYGAAGIGLGRIATARCGYADPATVETDVRHAVACALDTPTSSLDHLCCGNLGAIEFLCEAAAFQPDAKLAQEAERRLLQIVMDAQASGDYRWTHGDAAFNPGFFRGLAGVGYTMLRRVSPDLPNVLVWA